MPLNKKLILIIGECGVGKTWVMKNLKGSGRGHKKLGKFIFHENEKIILTGRYIGHTFDGSDRLSMSVMSDLNFMIEYINISGKLAFFEGDRFMNSNFIKKCNPYIIKIGGDGSKGRELRGTSQSQRQLKAIKTRVLKTQEDILVKNSNECLEKIREITG